MLYPTLAEQFARRQRDWKPNEYGAVIHLVDGVPRYTPPNAENEILECFDLLAWQVCPSQQL